MRVCVLGLGVIGTTYAYVLKKTGCAVHHLLRPEKAHNAPKSLHVHMLDGRYNNKGEEKDGTYTVEQAEKGAHYDFILISVGSGKLASAMETIRNNGIRGTVVLFCNFWDNRTAIEHIIGDYPYILAFPTAGGHLENGTLDCVLFDHIMLESQSKCKATNYQDLTNLLARADIKVEIPHDMVEWIWIHMAINAGVTSTAARNGITDTPKQLAIALMGDSSALSLAVQTIRETLKVVQARGVNLKLYKSEILPYKLPARLAGIFMKRLFSSNELTRRIMTLHNDIQDITYGCTCVYNSGKEYGLDLPLFYGNMKMQDLNMSKAHTKIMGYTL